MADSPLTSGYRVLTRSESMRFIPSRGGIGFAYGFACASVLCMLFLVLNPSSYYASPTNAIHSSPTYHFSQVFAHIFTANSSFSPPSHTHSTNVNASIAHQSSNNSAVVDDDGHRLRSSSQISRKEGSGLVTPKDNHGSQNGMQGEPWMELKDCDLFEGSWVRDDSYPLYKSGSCPHIDEPFNCFLNGRSDNMFEKFRWQPKNCNIPRLFFCIHVINVYICRKDSK